MRVRVLWGIVREAGEAWLDDRAPRIGAAIAFFTALSLAPLLVIALVIAGLVYGEGAARGEVADRLAGLVGPDAAKTVEDVLANSGAPRAGAAALVVSLVTLFVGATGVFVELQEALNDVWKVRPKPGRPVRTFVRGRLMSFGMVLGVGLLLLVSLVLGSAVDAAGRAAGQVSGAAAALRAVNLALAFAVEVVLFGMIFKVLPDAHLAWRDVGTGAVLTAALFNLGKYLVGLFLGYSGVTTAFGAAGSLMAFLVWIYFSALVLVFGAEVAKVTAAWAGRRIPPAAHAEVVPGATTPVSGSA
ncbi:MAG TPA: YihY/virulence factor BrkB family protein [Gemmataceae bacterium]|nr:YihY/virulence factor BrkB family protein [Gemmataceae bacterium]